MKVISCFAVYILLGFVSCQDDGNIASDILKGTTLCMKRFVGTTGHDISTMGFTGYKPPCDIWEAYMACSLENVENDIGTDMTPDIAIFIQKQLSQQMQQAHLNCSLNITALVEKIHDGTAPTLGPPGNSSIPAIDAMAACMDNYTKSIQNMENMTEICPKMYDFAKCYFRSPGLNISDMNDTQKQNLQYQWDNQITQVEHQTGTKLNCHIDINQIFEEILNETRATISLPPVVTSRPTGPPPLMTLKVSPDHLTPGITDALDVTCTIRHPRDAEFSSLLSLIVSKTSTPDDSDTAFSEIATLTSFSGDNPEVNVSVTGVNVSGHIEATKDSFMTLSWANITSQNAGRYMCEAWGMDKRGHPSMVASVVTVVQDIRLEASVKLMIDNLQDRLHTCEEDKSNTTSRLNQCMNSTSSQGVSQHNANLTACQQDLQKAQIELQILKANQSTNMFTSFMAEYLEFVSAPLDGHLYYVSKTMNFNVSFAETLCTRWGGYIVEGDNQKELTFVTNILYNNFQNDKYNHNNMLVGAFKVDQNGSARFIHSGNTTSIFGPTTGSPCIHVDYFGQHKNLEPCCGCNWDGSIICEIP